MEYGWITATAAGLGATAFVLQAVRRLGQYEQKMENLEFWLQKIDERLDRIERNGHTNA